jgi:sporulation protein YlmC with PRC-barrel domain
MSTQIVPFPRELSVPYIYLKAVQVDVVLSPPSSKGKNYGTRLKASAAR